MTAEFELLRGVRTVVADPASRPEAVCTADASMAQRPVESRESPLTALIHALPSSECAASANVSTWKLDSNGSCATDCRRCATASRPVSVCIATVSTWSAARPTCGSTEAVRIAAATACRPAGSSMAAVCNRVNCSALCGSVDTSRRNDASASLFAPFADEGTNSR